MIQIKLHKEKTSLTFLLKYAEISEKLFKTCLACLRTGNLPSAVQNGLLVTYVCRGTPENFAYACKTKCKCAYILISFQILLHSSKAIRLNDPYFTFVFTKAC
jgi:hypothetical protein